MMKQTRSPSTVNNYDMMHEFLKQKLKDQPDLQEKLKFMNEEIN